MIFKKIKNIIKICYYSIKVFKTAPWLSTGRAYYAIWIPISERFIILRLCQKDDDIRRWGWYCSEISILHIICLSAKSNRLNLFSHSRPKWSCQLCYFVIKTVIEYNLIKHWNYDNTLLGFWSFNDYDSWSEIFIF